MTDQSIPVWAKRPGPDFDIQSHSDVDVVWVSSNTGEVLYQFAPGTQVPDNVGVLHIPAPSPKPSLWVRLRRQAPVYRKAIAAFVAALIPVATGVAALGLLHGSAQTIALSASGFLTLIGIPLGVAKAPANAPAPVSPGLALVQPSAPPDPGVAA